jgi:hypothetical protein
MNPLLKMRFAFAVVASITLSGCSGGTATDPTLKSGLPSVEAVSQISVEGVVGKSVSPGPTIRVTDSKTHEPLANIPVEFRAGSGGGVVANASANVVTDAAGIAVAREWILGTRAGLNYLNVYVNGTATITFSAVAKADVPAHLVPITPIDQAGLPNSEITGPAVYVRDQYQNPVSGFTVRFALADHRTQSLEQATWISDNTGRAMSGGWILGSQPGTTQTIASIPGAETLVFNAQILDPTAIKWYVLDSIRAGANDYTPGQMGVSEARIGISGFDPCLSKTQEGYFIDEVIYSEPGGAIYGSSGLYSLNNATLTISSLSNPATIQNGTLILQRPDPDFGFLFTWVYKEISP